jgi:hypothetical protein
VKCKVERDVLEEHYARVFAKTTTDVDIEGLLCNI